MFSTHAIGAALKMKVEDLRPKGAGWELRLHEKDGKDRVCKFLPMAQELRDSWPVFDEGLDNLVKALEPFAHPRNRVTDPRSQWHDTAVLFASRIEEHFRKTGLHPPTQKSARSSLVLAVQSLLSMAGFQVEAETIRKVLSA